MKRILLLLILTASLVNAQTAGDYIAWKINSDGTQQPQSFSPLALGNITSGATASATIRVTNGKRYLDINFPSTTTGATGATGSTGATGAQGASGAVSVTAPITNSGTSSSAQIAITAATTSAAGSMSAADKTKLDSLSSPTISNITIPSNGAGTAATYTLNATSGTIPTRTFAFITNSDTDGATITLGETSIAQGSELRVINVGTNAFTIVDTAGVSETSGNFTVGPNDVISFVYGTDRWFETSRSNN